MNHDDHAKKHGRHHGMIIAMFRHYHGKIMTWQPCFSNPGWSPTCVDYDISNKTNSHKYTWSFGVFSGAADDLFTKWIFKFIEVDIGWFCSVLIKNGQTLHNIEIKLK